MSLPEIDRNEGEHAYYVVNPVTQLKLVNLLEFPKSAAFMDPQTQHAIWASVG